MEKKIMYVFILVAIAVLIAGCTGSTPSTSNPPATTPPASQPPPSSNNATMHVNATVNLTPSASAVTINIQGFAFNPATVTVSKGTTVTWVNDDSAPHQIMSDDSSFQSSPLSNGNSYSHTFTTAGSYAYHCAIHPSMTGTIVVQ